MSMPTPNIPAIDETPAANGWFQIDVPSHGKIATIKKIVRHSGSGKPVLAKDILDKLKQLKVIHGIDHEAIEGLVKSVDENNIPEEPVTVAKGDVVDGENGSIEWLIEGITEKESQFLVAPGIKIALCKLSTKGTKGKNVFGKPTNPRPGFDQQIKDGNGVQYRHESDGEIIYETTATGMLGFKSGELSVSNGLNISDDKLQASMDIFSGNAIVTNNEITLEDIQNTLLSAGIIYGIDMDGIAKALAHAKESGGVAKNIIVAKGSPPKEGNDGHIDWQLDVNAEDINKRAVLPDQLIAIHSVFTNANDGIDVFGEPITGKDGHKINLICGEGVVRNEFGGRNELRAKWLGVVHFADNTISVKSGVKISADDMKVTMSLLRPDNESESGDITLSHVVSSLNEHGVVYGIKFDALKLILDNLNKEKKSKTDLLVAEGTPPENGINTRVEYDDKFSASGMLLPNGEINYQEKSYPWNVKAGDVIGKVIPAKRAEDGKNVKGVVIHAEAVKETTLVLEGVIQEVDGRLCVTEEGVLLVNDVHFKVSDTLDVEGDVCQRTGNIHSDKTVNVRGYVEPGLILETKGDAIIQNNVENATVNAEGNIIIKEGIRGNNSTIIAGGNVSVSFAENANLNAKGDVIIKNNIINCQTVCESKVIVGNKRSAKSAIVGATTQAIKGIEAPIIGSDSFSKTLIFAGAGMDDILEYKKLAQEITDIEAVLEKLSRLRTHYCKNPQPQAKQNALLTKLEETREIKNHESDSAKEEYERLKIMLEESKKAKVIVHRRIYPGVKIHILNRIYEVTEERGAGIFCLENDKIIYQPL